MFPTKYIKKFVRVSTIYCIYDVTDSEIIEFKIFTDFLINRGQTRFKLTDIYLIEFDPFIVIAIIVR